MNSNNLSLDEMCEEFLAPIREFTERDRALRREQRPATTTTSPLPD